MAISAEDFKNRLKDAQPMGWFEGETPVLDSLLLAVGDQLAFDYDQRNYMFAQKRVTSATDIFLELCAEDYLGIDQFPKKPSERDEDYRARIMQEMVQARGSRPAMISAIKNLTGYEPTVFEPARALDTGTWGGDLAYGVLGAWGSYDAPYECLMYVTRSNQGGISGFQALGQTDVPVGGYGVGKIMWASSEMIVTDVSDDDILNTVQKTQPLGVTVWVQISDAIS